MAGDYAVVCGECDPRSPVYFDEPEQRGEWVAVHGAATGHIQFLCVGAGHPALRSLCGKEMDQSDLPPTEWLIMDCLAARYRLGESYYTFPARLRKAADSLARKGLVIWKAATIERHIAVWLTPEGRKVALSERYQPPVADDLASTANDLDLIAKTATSPWVKSAAANLAADVRRALRTLGGKG